MKLGLLFTYGNSLKAWEKAGILHRDLRLYLDLQKNGIEICLITYGDKEDYLLARQFGFTVLCNKLKLPTFLFHFLLPILEFKNFRSFDLIKSHQFIGVWPAIFGKLFFHNKYIARGGYIPSYFNQNENNFFKRIIKGLFYWINEFLACKFADVVIVPSEEEINYLSKRYYQNKDKFKINTNFIDTDLFKPNLEINKDDRSVIFIGRFEKQKNPLLFLESLQGLENVRATMIGTGSLYGKIIDYIKDYKLNCEVINKKIPNEDLPQILNKHWIYILPSEFEGGSPKTILEAMSCGLPVISTDTFGTRNIFSGVENVGIKCNLKKDDIKNAIYSLINDNTSREQCGINARKFVLNNFSIEKVLDREIVIYKNLGLEI